MNRPSTAASRARAAGEQTGVTFDPTCREAAAQRLLQASASLKPEVDAYITAARWGLKRVDVRVREESWAP